MSDPPVMKIEDAPSRVRREHYRRERRNNVIAVLVIASLLALVTWGVLTLVR